MLLEMSLVEERDVALQEGIVRLQHGVFTCGCAEELIVLDLGTLVRTALGPSAFSVGEHGG